ncbi:hypothetical protein [Microcoleus sp. B9-D4]|uniref:hypothetical protein n=1 Tax=Microcoleus sp. B9-D4 TaxID=2818711 RepID=UPI002FCF748C
MQLFWIVAAPRPGNRPPQRRRLENFSGGLSVFLAPEPIDSRSRICLQLRDRAISRYYRSQIYCIYYCVHIG